MNILSGVRVLEFSIAWAGPLAGRYLGDLGADVIKLEHPTSRGIGVVAAGGYGTGKEEGWTWGKLPGPVFRSGIYPDADPGDRPWNRQAAFNKINRNKRSLCIDLKKPGGREIFEKLVANSDVVLNNFSPRGVRSLGIDYDSLKAINPRIITVSLSGFGATGPDQERVSWGPMLESQSGFAALTSYEGSTSPHKMGAAYPDPVGGTSGAFAVLAALAERERTGQGFHVDISQLETYASIGGELYLAASLGQAPQPIGNRSVRCAPQGVYRCEGDDEWIAISVASDDEWTALADMIGTPAVLDPALATLAARQARHDELDGVLSAFTAGREKFELTEALQRAGVTAFPSMKNGDLVEDPHLAARGFIVEWDQPQVGVRRYPGFPIHFSASGKPVMRPCPPLGADNHAVLSGVAGLSDDEIAALAANRTITDNPN